MKACYGRLSCDDERDGFQRAHGVRDDDHSHGQSHRDRDVLEFERPRAPFPIAQTEVQRRLDVAGRLRREGDSNMTPARLLGRQAVTHGTRFDVVRSVAGIRRLDPDHGLPVRVLECSAAVLEPLVRRGLESGQLAAGFRLRTDQQLIGVGVIACGEGHALCTARLIPASVDEEIGVADRLGAAEFESEVLVLAVRVEDADEPGIAFLEHGIRRRVVVVQRHAGRIQSRDLPKLGACPFGQPVRCESHQMSA